MIINTDFVAGMNYNKDAEILHIMMNNACYNVSSKEEISNLILNWDKKELFFEYIESQFNK